MHHETRYFFIIDAPIITFGSTMFPSRARLYLTEKHVSVDLMGSRHQRSSPTSGSRWAMPKAPSSGRALPILMRKFFRLEPRPGKAPALDDVDPQGGDIGALFDRYPGQFATSRVVWQSPASSKAALLWTGKEWIAPGTNKSTPMSEGGPRCFILFLSFGRQTKTAIRGRKRPRMASMPLLSKLVTQAYTAQRTSKVVTQASSAA
jgi:hypothetical protein